MRPKSFARTLVAAGVAAACAGAGMSAQASSHREAPFISKMPKVDGTDFYMFRSFEDGRDGFVTLIANYLPLQDSYGGPNYFTLDEEAIYEIHVDNNGDAAEDITFQFDVNNDYQNIAIDTGADNPVTVPVLTTQPGGVGPGVADTAGLNVIETYAVNVMRGDRRSGESQEANNADTGEATFTKPTDNIGQKSINDYATYANNHIFPIQIPGCSADGGDGPGQGRVFVGQRREAFYINLGEVFDLLNIAAAPGDPGGNPLGPRNGEDPDGNVTLDKNITSFALEVPIGCLTADGDQDTTNGDPVIGAWTTASVPQASVKDPTPTIDDPQAQGGAFTQVSRVGSPLVNEVVIGIDRKDAFNASEPSGDVDNFGTFVLFPTLPVLVNALFPSVEVPATPRNDLLEAFVTGIPGLTQPQAIADGGGTPGEMLRLNTSIPPQSAQDGNVLGFLGCDLAGFPNGRRPLDDITDIELTVAEGAITEANPNELQTCDLSDPNNPTVVNAGAVVTDQVGGTFDLGNDTFPYLVTPFPGSPNDIDGPN